MAAFVLLVVTLIRRLMREPMVLRSLIFPVLLTAGTLLGTLGVVSIARAPPVVAVPHDFEDRGFTEAIAEYELELQRVDDPAWAVRWGFARAGTDGTTLWTRGPVLEAGVVEKVLRDRKGSRWRIDADSQLPGVGGDAAQAFGQRLGRMIASIFALYGVVIGAGMIARDRDDGSLGVEFTLPLSRLIPGLARFFAASIVLAAFLVPSVGVFHSLVGIPDVGALCRLGIAACTASVGIGLATMASGGAKGGFAGPLSVAMVAALGAFLSGRFVPELEPWLPIASLWGEHDGWVPLLTALPVGLFGAWRVSRMEIG